MRLINAWTEFWQHWKRNSCDKVNINIIRAYNLICVDTQTSNYVFMYDDIAYTYIILVS